MAIVFWALILALAALILRQQRKLRAIDRELWYIRERMGSAPYMKENAWLLIPSENLQIRELAAEINRLLDIFYAQKAEYERSRQAMAQMLANIAHDLRTPLTVLKGYSELLSREAGQATGEVERATGEAEQEAGKGRLRELAAKMEEKTDELAATLGEYFTLSKITSGDREIDLQRENIAQICHEVILDYYDILEEKEFNVEIGIGASPEYVRVDADALKRILKNLIDNAILHGGAGKYLALRLERRGDKMVIEVEDHGPGIPEGEREQIFDRAYTTAHKGSGSGLGLTIAKALASQMGAELLVESEPGRRTVFALFLKS
ncbi:MAG: HAMP domain-containing histidine kinase [Roseburia sp.]|nr:HAMP domain-containing histidine kinase [Roseburia sp.]MCM1097997.1 HAMP domain-containing histidine kinase [Ruminococcus flavefaciens]